MLTDGRESKKEIPDHTDNARGAKMKARKAFGGWQRMRHPILAFLDLAIPAGLFTGCGTVGLAPPAPTGSTNVLVLMTSTANDKLAQFGLVPGIVTLAGTAGNSVTLYNNSNSVGFGSSGPGEWIHLNGAFEPLVTVSVPQGTYNSATVKVGYCQFTVLTADPTGQEGQDTYAQGTCGQGTGNTTVILPNPITISGTGMVLSLDLQVPKSYTLTGSGIAASYTISPVFTLAPVTVSSSPTNMLNGKIGPFLSQITSINSAGSSFVAQTTDDVSITVKSDDSTTYQGMDGFSSLAPDMPVNMDLAIQSDASLLATRVEAQDAASSAVFIGPTVYGPNAPHPGWFTIFALQGVACFPGGPVFCTNIFQYYSNTVFGVSGQFSNLQDLPFPPSFSASSLFLGQNVSVSTPGILTAQGIESVTMLALAPQTINGTVTAISDSNGFAAYTVVLAPYDPISTLQQTLVATNHLNSPNTITVYADANKQMLNTLPINPGSIARFTGLIFDDNGTLRMDCGQILDGVPE